MAKGGVLGNGIRAGFSASSPITYTSLTGEVLDLTLPQLNTDKVDTTVHGAVKFKKYMPGLTDVADGEIVILGDLDEVTSPEQTALFNHQATGAVLYWRVEIPANRQRTRWAVFEFAASVGNFEIGTPIDGRQENTISLVFDADPTSGVPFFNKLPTTGTPLLAP